MKKERHSPAKIKECYGSAALQILAIFIGLIIVSPVLYGLSLSFMRVSEILSRPPKLFPGSLYLDNYITALTKSQIPRFLLNSLIISLVCSIVRIWSWEQCLFLVM